MLRKGTWIALLTASCALATLSVSPAQAQYAGSSAITNWSGSCGGSTRDWWDDMCMAWRKKMGAKGWVQWWRNYNLAQGNRYSDNSAKPWGIDDTSNGLDWNDAGLMCMHGGWGSGRWNGSIYDKDPDNSCAASPNKMRVGVNSGGYLRFLHLSSCNSVRHEQRTEWFDAANGVHVVTGFHGLMYIGWLYVDEYANLADQGMNSRGVGNAWLDNMHHVDHWYNFWKTVCPMSIGFGATDTAARNILDETYNGHWSTPTPNWMWVRWFSGCDPDDGPPLP